MKSNASVKVIDNGLIVQTTLPVGAVCVYIKSFDIYACVSYQGREVLINKELLVLVE
jgi:hypothetical protein